MDKESCLNRIVYCRESVSFPAAEWGRVNSAMAKAQLRVLSRKACLLRSPISLFLTLHFMQFRLPVASAPLLAVRVCRGLLHRKVSVVSGGTVDVVCLRRREGRIYGIHGYAVIKKKQQKKTTHNRLNSLCSCSSVPFTHPGGGSRTE